MRMLDKLREKLFGKRETIPCVCGGEMVKQDFPVSRPIPSKFRLRVAVALGMTGWYFILLKSSRRRRNTKDGGKRKKRN